MAAGGQGDGVRLWTDFLGEERGERGWSFEGEKRRPGEEGACGGVSRRGMSKCSSSS